MKNILLSGFNDKYLDKVIVEVSKKFKIYKSIYSKNSVDKENNFAVVEDICRIDILLKNHPEVLDCNYSFETTAWYKDSLLAFLSTTDRVFVEPVPYNQLLDYYSLLLSFWSRYLESHSISTLFFQSTPHFPWDVALFFAAKHLKIKTFILRRTLIPNCVVFDRNFNNEKPDFFIFNRSFVGGFEQSELLKKFGSESTWIDYSRNILNDCLTRRDNMFGFVNFKKVLSAPIFLFKELSVSKKTYFQLGKVRYLTYVIKRFYQQRKLNKYWESISEDLPKSKKFAYFPLHFQPERSTDPECGHFSKQLNAIKLLLKILPKDWSIVVKEHPRQNMPEYPNLRRFHYRDINFYKSLQQLERVILISTKVDSREALSECSLAASCTGSILWESLNSGKPSISFGTNWHSSCESSPHISELIRNKSKLDDLLQKDKLQIKQDVLNFIQENHNSFIFASNSEQFLDKNISTDLNIRHLSQSMIYISQA